MEFPVLYIGSLIIICFIYNSVLYVHPNLLIYLPPPFPFGNYMFVFYVSQFCLLFIEHSYRARAMPWLPLCTGLVVWGVSEVAQSCPTLYDHMDCSLPCSSIHGIFQARVLECVAISLSRGSSQPKDRTRVSCTVGRRFTLWATREVSLKGWL